MTSWKIDSNRFDGSLNITNRNGKYYVNAGTAAEREVTDDDFERWGFERVTEWRWLASTLELQRDAFGDRDWPKTGEALANSVMMNALAIDNELHAEVLNEVGWKPWATPRGWVNRDAYLDELVDIGHFLANLVLAVGCTDDEWERRYRAKQDLNARRQRAGYDTRSSKCPSCHRSLDEVGVAQRPDTVHVGIGAFEFACGGCGVRLNTEAIIGDVMKCPVCHVKLGDGFRAPELTCDGTVEGCKMPDLATS